MIHVQIVHSTDKIILKYDMLGNLNEKEAFLRFDLKVC